MSGILTDAQVAMYRRLYDLDRVADDPEHTAIEFGDASALNAILDSHEQLRSDLATARAETLEARRIFAWLLGEEGEFPTSEPGRRYGFRSPLREKLRAAGIEPASPEPIRPAGEENA